MRVGQLAHRIQDEILSRLGRSPNDRTTLVRGMLAPQRGSGLGYWLQLTIATMLATLGLALDSTAVVIGAMLIAPLMRPLVEVAMGLATGSAALVVRAMVRTVASIAVVVVIAIAITWLLPFHEVTRELEARTAPSLLDLVVAAACALAASYATLRSDADIATTAAGTSIGISLVPPLCAVGYGVAIGDPSLWRGAALLFTANISGILAIATVVFVLVGFARVELRADEDQAVEGDRALSTRIGRWWSRLASARLGPFARFVPPVILIGIVFLPLQRAVGEIAHRSEIRRAVADLFAADRRRIVQFTLDQTSSDVILRVVVVGDAAAAAELERSVRARLVDVGVASPKLSVWAVPDAAAMTALSHRVDQIPPPATPEPTPVVAKRYSSEIASAIRSVWPASAGAIVEISLDLEHPDRVRVQHLGEPLGEVAMQLMSRAVGGSFGALVLEEDALSDVAAEPVQGRSWLLAATRLIARVHTPNANACVEAPPASSPATKAPVDEVTEVRATIETLVPHGHVIVGPRWRATVVLGKCPEPG